MAECGCLMVNVRKVKWFGMLVAYGMCTSVGTVKVGFLGGKSAKMPYFCGGVIYFTQT